MFVERSMPFSAENCRTRLFFEGSMSFKVRKIAARTCFSKDRCHLQSRNLPFALVFGRLDVIYDSENCRAHLFFKGSMAFRVRKIAVAHLFSEGSMPFRVRKIAVLACFRRLDDI